MGTKWLFFIESTGKFIEEKVYIDIFQAIFRAQVLRIELGVKIEYRRENRIERFTGDFVY